jgi:hypothetical protein
MPMIDVYAPADLFPVGSDRILNVTAVFRSFCYLHVNRKGTCVIY